MTQRICTIDGCERKHSARGLCAMHWRREYGATKTVEVACPMCGTVTSKRADGPATRRFCSLLCRDVWRIETGNNPAPAKRHVGGTQRLCRLPADHRVMMLIATAGRPRHDPRECPGCGCWFTPLVHRTKQHCSARCKRRVHNRLRRAREHGARGTWVWSDFMRIARRFGYRCAYCGTQPGQLDPEHVVPLSRGGVNNTTNLLPSCSPCNSDKRDLMLDEWARDRERRGLPPVASHWPPEDKRYWHLTQELLRISPAA